ncbi:unnamed protein product, partial [Brenthis ino]
MTGVQTLVLITQMKAFCGIRIRDRWHRSRELETLTRRSYFNNVNVVEQLYAEAAMNLARALRRLASARYLRGGGPAPDSRGTRDSAFPGRAAAAIAARQIRTARADLALPPTTLATLCPPICPCATTVPRLHSCRLPARNWRFKLHSDLNSIGCSIGHNCSANTRLLSGDRI